VEARNGGEGTADSGWILLDFGSVIVNVMTPVARKYYALEKLWKKVSSSLPPSLFPSLPHSQYWHGGQWGDAARLWYCHCECDDARG